ncbi:MAG: hypothetical protein K2Q11_10330 [Burkholderiaceae bacterium]|nr:hypothetical protein [Burkholderiaceae bacterium]
MTQNFDLRSLSIAQTADMPVRDAAGEPQFAADGETPITITLHSPGSKPYQRAKHALEDRANTRYLARAQGKTDGKQTAEEKLRERAEFLASCTVSINGASFGDVSGYEGFKALYADITVGHIADDAEKFLAERANFKRASAQA